MIEGKRLFVLDRFRFSLDEKYFLILAVLLDIASGHVVRSVIENSCLFLQVLNLSSGVESCTFCAIFTSEYTRSRLRLCNADLM